MLGGSDSQSAGTSSANDLNANQAGNEQGRNITGPNVSASGKYVRNETVVNADDLSGNTGNIYELGDIKVGRHGSFSMTDHGAVSAALEFGSEAVKASNDFGANALFFADQAAARANTQSLEALGTVERMNASHTKASLIVYIGRKVA